MLKVRLLIVSSLISLVNASGQLDREGTPVSWNIGQDLVSHSVWETFSIPNLSVLFAEDQATSGKDIPTRFAYAHDVSFDPDNSGHWTNLENGDRIWVLGIECESALSISITFSYLNLPRGSRIYLYSDNHQDYVGPLTSSDNRSLPLGTPHISGSKLIVEYYEPYAYRGDGDFRIQHISQAYRNIYDFTSAQEESCIEMVELTPNNPQMTNSSSSVLRMLVDKGQRIATATLVNNTSYSAIPYVITSTSALIGHPASWVFQFDVRKNICTGNFNGCSTSAICGAYTIENDPSSGIALLKLRNQPKNSWSAYYSGWKLQSEEDDGLICIQHGLGLPQSQSFYNTELAPSSLNGLSTYSTDSAIEGGTFGGSTGSPLFDADMNLIGVFVGGDSECQSGGKDHFILLTSIWHEFRDHLDPIEASPARLEGTYPKQNESGSSVSELQVSFFPNPANEWIYVETENESVLSEIIVFDSSGRIIKRMKPLVPTVDVSDLPEGFYSITFVSGNASVTRSLLIR